MKYLVLFLGLLATPANAASFDCAKAASPDERAVCDDPRLSELDEVNARAFNQAKQASNSAEARRDVITSARAFLKDRLACGTDRSCLLSQYLGALIANQNFGAKEVIPAWATAAAIAGDERPSSVWIPTKVGQCSMTEIADVTPRLDSGRPRTDQDFNSGTAVSFRNGLSQVSYEREAALLNSRPGDKSIVCLISIPRGCPPGDNRGRFYAVTNTRTRGSWTLPDSQHRCGGA